MRALRRSIPETAPILLHKNKPESGQRCAKSSAPERSWGSIEGNVGGPAVEAASPIARGEGEGDAEQATPGVAGLLGQLRDLGKVVGTELQ